MPVLLLSSKIWMFRYNNNWDDSCFVVIMRNNDWDDAYSFVIVRNNDWDDAYSFVADRKIYFLAKFKII